jgi:hypothetical protein
MVNCNNMYASIPDRTVLQEWERRDALFELPALAQAQNFAAEMGM